VTWCLFVILILIFIHIVMLVIPPCVRNVVFVALQMRQVSPYGRVAGWRLMPVIVKSNDDLRQEQFVSQLLFQFDSIFKAAKLPVWLRPYGTTTGDALAAPTSRSLSLLLNPTPARHHDTPSTLALALLTRSFPRGVPFGSLPCSAQRLLECAR
jgi:hypothetical protein